MAVGKVCAIAEGLLNTKLDGNLILNSYLLLKALAMARMNSTVSNVAITHIFLKATLIAKLLLSTGNLMNKLRNKIIQMQMK